MQISESSWVISNVIMERIVKKRILGIKPYQPGKPIKEVQRELGLKDVIKLASNENPYGPSPMVLKTIQKEAKSINRYPDGGCFYLRAELAKKLKVKKNQLIFGNGSDEIIICALRAFVSEGDEVIIAKPSFLMYGISSQVVGATIKAVPLLKDFRYDLSKMLKSVSMKTKLIFIGNPDNPSGQYVSQSQLATFLKILRKDVLVFMDEAYFEYVRAKDYPNTLKLLKKHKNLIVARTFSKIYGLAGLRVGYAVADKKIIDILNRIREPFNVNSLAQAAAIACLKDQKYYRSISKKIEQQRQFLYKNLMSLKSEFVRTYTNFILIKVNKNSSSVVKQLMKEGIIVRDMAAWGLNTFIRVTIGTAQENQRFIKTLKKVMKR